ncbi:MAG TPA: D-alanyl-D-alanine carboxypeptidase [Micavibrio sp.]
MGYASHILRIVMTIIVVVSVVAGSLAPSPAAAAQKKAKKSSGANNRYASIVMDAETGAILSQSNPDKQLHPASLTKIMTLLLTFEAIENGQFSLRDRVVMTRAAVNMMPSKIGLPVGASMRVEDAIYALVTKSANDVAVALGEKIGGSESRFAVMMTRKAREIGMNSTRFVNASGWHNPAQVSSARDMAILARYVIYRYPQYYHYFGTKNFTFQGKNYHNHNRLMNEYAGMDGMKTGYVGASGFNLVASAKRGNKRLIGVVFGGRSTASRNAHMAELLNRGFTGQGIAKDALVASAAASNAVIAAARSAPLIPGRKPGSAAVSVAQNTAAAPVNPSVNQSISGVAAAPAVIALPQTTGTPIVVGSLQNDVMSEAAGQGDFDPAEITAERPWAIQIGAFASRVQTDKAIRAAMKALPASLANAQPVIVPLKTAEGWVFRGRLSGYTKEQAQKACARLRECLPVSPDAVAR